MASTKKHRVCPVERAGQLDGILRAVFQNPDKIVGPYVAEGMHILDMGCGPGFFTLPLARRAAETGRVTGCDLQEGMLHIIGKKLEATDLRNITLHQCTEKSLGLDGPFDLVLVFYVAHELPDQAAFFRELSGLMSPGGKILIVEPMFHVSRKSFNKMLDLAGQYSFRLIGRPFIWFSMAALLEL